ncbi:DUF599 domain-containing protein [Desulfohalobiaceae bacterium Ax17]|uniref:DUF599 domain-containing protein n=1 Tax=Desulfovulcanus ferrireducens TaxID=2831190 RepID=UPI00207B9D78|nr:DUF599 domain-containing protein [Desulfovulcanus ferrireducens]MBT8763679.1 DUF599 domain-containing protein [Desulfovulcanus ferrireducens]
MELIDIIALIVFLLCYVGYHGFYLFLLRKCPQRTVKSYVNKFREDGIEHMIAKDNHIVIIQAIRDVIMVCNFLASSTLIFIGALLNLLLNIDKIEKNLQIWNFNLFEFKILFMVGILSASFIFLVSALRYYRHVAMMVMTRPETIMKYTGEPAPKYIGALLNSGCGYYTLGSRGLMYSLLLLVWMINTLSFIFVVIAITVLFAVYRDLQLKSC